MTSDRLQKAPEAAQIQGRFLIIRHAQSANNALPEHLRVCDPGLTDVGHKQAHHLAEYLANWPIAHLYCSGFLRSLETTAAIAKLNRLRPFVHSQLFEAKGCYSGHVEGNLVSEPGLGRLAILQKFEGWEIDEAITDQGWHFGRPVESHELLIQRSNDVVNWMSQRLLVAPNQGLEAANPAWHAMVIHADFKQTLLSALMNANIKSKDSAPRATHNQPWEVETPWNTSVTQVELVGGQWNVVRYNEVTHLADHLLTA